MRSPRQREGRLKMHARMPALLGRALRQAKESPRGDSSAHALLALTPSHRTSPANKYKPMNLNLFTRSEATVSAMDTTGVRHSVCSDSSTHHNTDTQIQHLPLIKHTSLSPRSHRRPPNQPHYVNYEIITDKPPRSPIGGLNTPPRSSHLRCLSRPS